MSTMPARKVSKGKLASEWLCFIYDYVLVSPGEEAEILFQGDERAGNYWWMPDCGWMWAYDCDGFSDG